MQVVRIEEVSREYGLVEIMVDGILDRKSMPILDEVCRRYFSGNKKIMLNLTGLTHITREGRNFLAEIQHKVTLVNMPLSVKLN